MVKALEKAEADYETLKENNKLKITYMSSEEIIAGKEENLVIKSNGELENLVEVLLNGEKWDSENYTLAKGSTILTLKKEFLAKLSAGDYKLSLVYNDGRSVDTSFKIAEAKAEVPAQQSGNPKTGDNIILWISLAIVSMVCIVGTKKITNKKRIYCWRCYSRNNYNWRW